MTMRLTSVIFFFGCAALGSMGVRMLKKQRGHQAATTADLSDAEKVQKVTANETWGWPAPAPVGSSYTRIACWEDKGQRTLPVNKGMSIPNNSPAVCSQLCKGYLFFGLQWQKECFCGNTFPYQTDYKPDSDCNRPCPGQPGVTCGGYWRQDVYSNSHWTAAELADAAVAWSSMSGAAVEADAQLDVKADVEASLEVEADAEGRWSSPVMNLTAASHAGSTTASSGGVIMSGPSPVYVDGVMAWNLDGATLGRTGGSNWAVDQEYTHCAWIKWRAGQNNQWRTLFRGSADHSVLVYYQSTELGMYSNRDGGWFGTGFHITADAWQFVCVVGRGDSATSTRGTSTFYVAGQSVWDSVNQVGTAPRVVSGTTVYQIGLGGQGPGKLASFYAWNYALSKSELDYVHFYTSPFGF